MEMRSGLALTLALGLVLSGCASSGGGTTAAPAATTGPTGSGANLLAQGVRPRDTDNTEAAEEAIGEAQDAATPEAARAQYQVAMQAAEAAITEDPTNPLAYRLAGHAALGLEDYTAAALHFDNAVERRPIYDIEIAPFREEAYINLYGEALPLLQSGEYLPAAEILEDANTIFPNRADALILMAQIYAQERQHDQALERIDQAIAFLGSDRMAEFDSATVTQWRQDGANLPLIRGQVLVDAGRFEEAVAAYRGIIAQDPSNIAVTQDLAAILMTMDREDEALAVYNTLLSRPGLGPQDFYRIGVGFYNASDYGRAADAFGRGVALSSRDRDGIEMWARALLLDSAYVQVPPVAERWIALDPSSQMGITVLAQAINRTGDAQAAGAAMRRAEALLVTVDDLEMRRGGTGPVVVSGSIANRSIASGDRVTLTFTFYSDAGQAIGTATYQATVADVGAKQIFQVDFESTQPVGGYGYAVTRG